MTIDPIHLGSAPNDGTGQNLRSGGQVINNNFSELDARTATAQAKAEQGVSDAASAKSAALAAQSSADKAQAKLVGIDQGATKNKSDSELLNRSNHTGAQTADTISNFSQTVRTTTLSGVALSTSPIIEPDTVLVAMGKLQGQLNQRIRKGEYGIGATGAANVAVWPNASLNNVTSVGSGTYVTVGGTQDMPTTVGGPWTVEYRVRTTSTNSIECTQVITNLQGVIMSRGGSGTPSNVPFTGWVQILRAGDYGITGSLQRSPAGVNIDNLPGYTHRVWIDPLSSGGPVAGQDWVIEHMFIATGYALQQAQSLDPIRPGVFTRSQNAGVWSQWISSGVETITNANGTATKFPDGTMICRGNTAGRLITNVPSGSIFQSPLQTLNFAAAFVGTSPSVSVSAPYSENANSWSSVQFVGLSSISASVYSPVGTGAALIFYTAIGRWR
ncbi:hypothetical protein K5F93_24785 [Pseudomonas protegens]|uniref:hypothetical protein n=1 Tax=Pseudomonas protegens TaxID=380021 RepID=UPI001C8DF941|nr:hypothetical protein [Pseudomonas protegens]QZI69542.1 hypothetical protein K5F93_24785 [Pseudomonas protegens]